mmetsp:Transcript_33048/g.106896  ORF Transcript_33048/g.106896 Transcript_33048/m.106896 type:complete len:355 (+) Transcript_33048:47-1111(+)
MAATLALALALGGASALLAGIRTVVVPLQVAMSSPSSWDEYMKERQKGTLAGGTIDESNAAMEAFLKGGGDSEFDGGDSGGGVVGDGNTDLSDQHNSASIVRGGFGQATIANGGANVGRGRVEAATNARQASAGKNYFGRSTGLAEEMISKITEDDRKTGRMDEVRAQQFENWFNQRAIHKSNKEQGQGVVFGAQKDLARSNFNTQEAISSNVWRQGAQDNEISQKDLASHLQQLVSLPAQRLDGEDWGALTLDPNELPTQTFEIRAGVRKTSLTEIAVKNMFNTFAPYRCLFTADSDPDFSVSPNHGTMNRRTGEPISVVVRFTPQQVKDGAVATLVFETEDMRNIYKFIAST